MRRGAVADEKPALAALVARWRAQADAYEADGQPGASLLRRVATELEEALRAHALEALTVAEAARESGYSASQLRRRVPGPRAIRREDLPRKARGANGPDLAGALLRGERA